jgi:hypothetical protein
MFMVCGVQVHIKGINNVARSSAELESSTTEVLYCRSSI